MYILFKPIPKAFFAVDVSITGKVADGGRPNLLILER